MRCVTLFLAWVCVAGPLRAEEPGKAGITFEFDKGMLGKVPPGWKADQTGKGEGSIWKVVADDSAPSKTGFVLAQTAAGPGPLFNLCLFEGIKARDVEISVQFKAVKGELDQGGGIVWRYQDAKNYYVARMNPLEDNYRVYKVIDGKRMQLESAGNIKVLAGTWHRITIKHVGKKIECQLDGKKLLDAEDDAIAAAGLTGLWTKADAQSYFDAFTVPVVQPEKK
jgi:hypothetical protein